MGHLDSATRQGLIYGVLAFSLWGFGPIYFKAVTEVAAAEILAHRILWSVPFLGLLLFWRRGVTLAKQILTTPRLLRWLALSATLVAANWLTFIWAIGHNQIVEASLGYFMNPLFSVLLGVLFLRERPRPLQWLALGLAGLGVLNQVVAVGVLPWVATGLMLTFGFYGLIRKHLSVDPVIGLLVETLLLLPAALGYLLWLGMQDQLSFGQLSLRLDLLLAAAGLVTALPLVFHAAATNRLSLTLMGLLQYIAPSMTFLLAILVYQEPFSLAQLTTFSLIWTALALYTAEGWLRHRGRHPQAHPHQA